MTVIKKEEFLFGIRHWVQMYHTRLPRIEVFRYIGCDKSVGIYYFESVKHGTIIGRSFYQLNGISGFRPFCFDFARITALMEEKLDAPV